MKTRANQVAALFNNVNAMEKAYNEAMNSAGVAARENEVYLDSIAGRTAQLKSSFQALSSDIISSDVVKIVITIGDGITQLTDKFVNLGAVVNETLNSIGAFNGVIPSMLGVDNKNQEKYFNQLKALPSILSAISFAVSAKTGGQATGKLGKKLPSVRAIERMHKPENCWKPLILVDQIAA